jgi:Zn-dependent protease
MELNVVQLIVVFALPVIFAITLHEAAHGYVAKYFGDLTAYQSGRVSLNPIRHIDPVGTILVPALILLTSKLLGGGFILFGWAKPVPVNFGRLRHPKKDMLWVAAAGPLANLAMAVLWALMMKIGLGLAGNSFAVPMALMGVAGIFINSVLMTLNLFPLPPLDGGRIAVSLLPNPYAYRFSQIEPYGMMILLLLLFTGVLGLFLWPIVQMTMFATVALVGVDPTQFLSLLMSLLK